MANPVATLARDPAKQARGRRGILWMVGSIVLAQALAGYLLDRHGLAIRFSSASDVIAAGEVVGSPNVVWLGTSRSQGGIRPEVIKAGVWKHFGEDRVNLFNAAVPVGDPYTSEFIFDALLERGHRP